MLAWVIHHLREQNRTAGSQWSPRPPVMDTAWMRPYARVFFMHGRRVDDIQGQGHFDQLLAGCAIGLHVFTSVASPGQDRASCCRRR